MQILNCNEGCCLDCYDVLLQRLRVQKQKNQGRISGSIDYLGTEIN